jgi:glycosyltransferase involved in cell wall biosynthesis
MSSSEERGGVRSPTRKSVPLTSPQGPDSESEIMFSVVIGTFNGERCLGAALDALEAQDTEFSYEIVVVNDASTDSTAQIASRPGVRLINLSSNQGHGHALNVGLAEANGRYMALMDDDCVPPQQWIQELGLAWNKVGGDVTMIGGVVEPLTIDTFNRRYVAFRRPLRHQELDIDENAGLWSRLRHHLVPPPMHAKERPVYYTVGANMSVRVRAAREAGGFTEARGAGEEESLARPLRARFGPGTVQLFPSIVMRHDFDPSLPDTLRRSRSYGRTSGRDWAKNVGIPSLSPLPFCSVLLAGLTAIYNPLLSLVVLVVSPYALYRRWFTWMRESGSREAFIYPFVQAIEDVANDVGFAQGAWREFQTHRKEKEGA